MAQILLSGVKVFCGLPAHEILGPILMTVNPLNLLNILCYVAWLVGVRYSKRLASFSQGSWKRSAEWAAAFYAATMFVVYLIIFAVMCGAASRL